MSKYTTEVRFICETMAGLDESAGYTDVDEIIRLAYPKIFKVDMIPMFEGETEEHRAQLYQKILGHYYTREIGYETVGLWKLKLNQKMMEIMPYYNKLYESELLEFDPLKNVDRTLTDSEAGTKNASGNSDGTRNETRNETTNTTLRHEKKTTRGNDTNTNVINSAEDAWSLFSDTPEGGITGIENASSGSSVGNNAYLTNATHNIVNPSGQTVTNTHGDVTEVYNPSGDRVDTVAMGGNYSSADHNQMQSAENNTRNATHHLVGKEGGDSYSKMLEEYRKTLLNIDMKVIDELKDLFMNLW